MTSGRPDEDRASDRKSADGAATAAVEDPGPDAPAPGDAFGALGGETRLAVVEALDEASPRTFSDLVDATDADTSAGFAYHLRQLTGRFVRRRADERYESTDAGRSVARALVAGTYTASVDRDPWCVVVSARLDGEDLVCYVGGDGRVVDHRRESHDDRPSAGSATGDDTDSSADSDSSAVSTDDAESARASDAVESGAAES
jgi:hypothetical protein